MLGSNCLYQLNYLEALSDFFFKEALAAGAKQLGPSQKLHELFCASATPVPSCTQQSLSYPKLSLTESLLPINFHSFKSTQNIQGQGTPRGLLTCKLRTQSLRVMDDIFPEQFKFWYPSNILK